MCHYKVNVPETLKVARVSEPVVVKVFDPGAIAKVPGLFAVGNLKITIPDPPVPPGPPGPLGAPYEFPPPPPPVLACALAPFALAPPPAPPIVTGKQVDQV